MHVRNTEYKIKIPNLTDTHDGNTKCLWKNWTKKELLNREKCALIMFIGKQYNIIFSVFLVDVKKIVREYVNWNGLRNE